MEGQKREKSQIFRGEKKHRWEAVDLNERGKEEMIKDERGLLSRGDGHREEKKIKG